MSTIPVWLQRNAQQTPERVAALSVARGIGLTHAELLGLCGGVGRALAKRGIGANDRVALVARNSLEHLVTYLGVTAHGATICTVEPDMSPDLSGLLRALGPRLVLHGADQTIAGLDDPAEVMPLGQLDETATGFCAELGSRPQRLPDRASSPSDVASIFYTSGTEATPKGIVCSFAELEGNAEPTADAFGIAGDDRVLEFRSLNWLSAQVLGGLAPLCKGATLLLADGFSRSRFFDWIADHGATIATGNPTTINMLLNRPVELSPESVRQLRFVTSSSAPLLPEDWKAFEELYGVRIAQGYGSSETGWIAASNERTRRLGSVGKPLPYHRLSIVDEAGEDLPPGRIGAIELGGRPQTEYRHLAADGSVRADARGRIRTGDTGYVDDDGFLFLTGRVKDVIIRGGVNIAPVEIDTVISRLPAVAEVLTIGVADRIYGEEIVAYVAPRAGVALDAAAVLEHCRANLAENKVPREIVMRDSLPKTGRGKLDRAALVSEWERSRASSTPQPEPSAPG